MAHDSKSIFSTPGKQDAGAIGNPLVAYLHKTGRGIEELSSVTGLSAGLIEQWTNMDARPNAGLLAIMDVALKRPRGSFQSEFLAWENLQN